MASFGGYYPSAYLTLQNEINGLSSITSSNSPSLWASYPANTGGLGFIDVSGAYMSNIASIFSDSVSASNVITFQPDSGFRDVGEQLSTLFGSGGGVGPTGPPGPPGPAISSFTDMTFQSSIGANLYCSQVYLGLPPPFASTDLNSQINYLGSTVPDLSTSISTLTSENQNQSTSISSLTVSISTATGINQQQSTLLSTITNINGMNIFVDPIRGVDTNNGLNINTPLKTISSAISKCIPNINSNYTINLAPNSYSGNGNNNLVFDKAKITLTGNPNVSHKHSLMYPSILNSKIIINTSTTSQLYYDSIHLNGLFLDNTPITVSSTTSTCSLLLSGVKIASPSTCLKLENTSKNVIVRAEDCYINGTNNNPAISVGSSNVLVINNSVIQYEGSTFAIRVAGVGSRLNTQNTTIRSENSFSTIVLLDQSATTTIPNAFLNTSFEYGTLTGGAERSALKFNNQDASGVVIAAIVGNSGFVGSNTANHWITSVGTTPAAALRQLFVGNSLAGPGSSSTAPTTIQKTNLSSL